MPAHGTPRPCTPQLTAPLLFLPCAHAHAQVVRGIFARVVLANTPNTAAALAGTAQVRAPRGLAWVGPGLAHMATCGCLKQGRQFGPAGTAW